MPGSNEETLLRSVALQNAQSILLARQRAEEELLRVQQELQRQSELLQVTLSSIGDAVVSTDKEGRVLFLNRAAEKLTGWTQPEARGRLLTDVFRIINEDSRQPVENPAVAAFREGRAVGLPNHTILIARDGTEVPIDDSAAPIRDGQGNILGVVLVFRDIVERRRSENALRRSERDLSDFFDNAPVGLHWVGPDGTILRVNRAELDMLGYVHEEYVGRHIAEFHVDRDVIELILKRLHAGEELRDCEARMRCKDGSIKYVVINSNVFWENGKFIRSRCFTRDITERWLTDEIQARLAAIVESSEDAIIGKTLDGQIVSWNAGAERLFGYRADEAIGELITLLIPLDRRDEENHIMERLRRGERIEHFETVRVTKKGRRINISLTISPIRDRAGRLIGASKIARDTTTRRQTEQTTRFLAVASAALAELTDSESTLQKVAGLAVPAFADWCAVDIVEHDGSLRRLAVTHSDPEKVWFVQELDRRYPTSAADPGGVGRALRTGEPDWEPVIPDEMLAGPAKDEEYLRSIRELGLKSYICVPLKSRGKVLGVLTFVTAESGRYYNVDDLRTAEDLAHRTVIAIENASLLAVLQDTDRRKDEFLAMLAHELRNPLAPIRNAVQIFREKGPLEAELQWATEVVARQAEQMTRLVDDLLDISRVTRGKIELRREIAQLETLVEHAVESSRPLINSRRHAFLVEIPPEPISLDVDPIRFAQILSNLLNNAAKYMTEGGRIWLSARRDGVILEIRVKDAGIGIPKEMLPRIFDMFMQVDRTLERSQGGLGIGLTLVQRLVESHGGSVEARSEGPGKGSEFIVRLPLAMTEEVEAQPGTRSGEHVAVPAKRRILIVDDNQDSAKSLAMLLRLMGNEVQAVFDGIEAINAATAFHPDLILLDIGLPKLNGYDVARRIRAEHGNEMVLVALTGWGQEDDRRRSTEAGFDHHLTKPVDIGALQALLANPEFQISTWTPV